MVKENQKNLLNSLKSIDFANANKCSSVDRDHGRIEERDLEVIARTSLHNLSFPYVEQIFRIHRKRFTLEGEILSEELVYGVTSRSSKKLPPEQLLAGIRGHWLIENCEHYVKDVTFQEDRCRIRLKRNAQMFSIFRNLSINVLRKLGFKNIAKGVRTFTYGPKSLAIRALGIT